MNCASLRCCLEKEASETQEKAGGWTQEATDYLEERSGFLSVKIWVLSFGDGYDSE